MLNNHLYNLMAQLVEEHKSLWRIRNMYKEDAEDCAECLAFLEELEQDKEEHVQDLLDLIQAHL